MRKIDKIKYPTVSEIIETNRFVLQEIKVSKKDYHRVYHEDRILEILEGTRKLKGDVYDKAVYLLKNLIMRHPFGSANRRTAYIITHIFLWENFGKAPHIKTEKAEKFLEGVRRGWVSDKEVKLWLQGKMK